MKYFIPFLLMLQPCLMYANSEDGLVDPQFYEVSLINVDDHIYKVLLIEHYQYCPCGEYINQD